MKYQSSTEYVELLNTVRLFLLKVSFIQEDTSVDLSDDAILHELGNYLRDPVNRENVVIRTMISPVFNVIDEIYIEKSALSPLPETANDPDIKILFLLLRLLTNFVADSNSNNDFLIEVHSKDLNRVIEYLDRNTIPNAYDDSTGARRTFIRGIITFLNNMAIDSDTALEYFRSYRSSKELHDGLERSLVSFLLSIRFDIDYKPKYEESMFIFDFLETLLAGCKSNGTDSPLVASSDIAIFASLLQDLCTLAERKRFFVSEYEIETSSGSIVEARKKVQLLDSDEVEEFSDAFSSLVNCVYSISLFENWKFEETRLDSLPEVRLADVLDACIEKGFLKDGSFYPFMETLLNTCLNFSMHKNNDNKVVLLNIYDYLCKDGVLESSSSSKSLNNTQGARMKLSLMLIYLGNYITSVAHREEVVTQLSQNNAELIQRLFYTFERFVTLDTEYPAERKISYHTFQAVFLMNRIIGDKRALDSYFKSDYSSKVIINLLDKQEELYANKLGMIYGTIITFATKLIESVVRNQRVDYLRSLLRRDSTDVIVKEHNVMFQKLIEVFEDTPHTDPNKKQLEQMLCTAINGILLYLPFDSSDSYNIYGGGLYYLVNLVFLKPHSTELVHSHNSPSFMGESQVPLSYYSERTKTLGLLLKQKDTKYTGCFAEDLRERLVSSPVVHEIINKTYETIEVLEPQSDAIGPEYKTLVNNLKFVCASMKSGLMNDILLKLSKN